MGAGLRLHRALRKMKTRSTAIQRRQEKLFLPWWNRNKHFLKKIFFLLILVAFGTVGWRLVRMGLNAQCESLIKTAITFRVSGNNEDAKLALQTAVRLQPDGPPELLRNLAELCAASDLEIPALKIYRSLWRAKKLTFGDARRMSNLAVKLNEPLTIRYLFDYLQVKSGGSLLPLLLKARARMESGDWVKALADLQDASNKDYKVGLQVGIREQLHSLPAPFATTNNGKDILDELSEKIGDRSALPIYLGLLKACVPLESQTEWAYRLKKHPACDMRMRLLADSILARRSPATKPALAAEVLALAQDKPLPDRILAAQWLLREQEPAQASLLITEEEAFEDTHAFPVWFEANAACGQSNRLLGAVSRLREKMPYAIWLFRSAQALELSGKTDSSREAKLAAFEQGKKNPATFTQLLQLSALAGDKETLPLYLQATAKDTSRNEKLRNLVVEVRKSRDTNLLADVLFAINTAILPSSDPSLRSELEYTNLLLGREVNWNELKKAAQQKPATPERLFPYLAGLVASGNAKEALQQLIKKQPELDARSLEPWQQAIMVWIFAKNERREEAREFATLIPPHGLSIQEQALLENFLQTAATSSPALP